MGRQRQGSLGFLHPELVHAGERLRISQLEEVPKIEIDHRRDVREPDPESLGGRRGNVKSEKFEIMVRKESHDDGNRQPMFLNVKQQIPALALPHEIQGARRCGPA
jgi:hypothetical protein